MCRTWGGGNFEAPEVAKCLTDQDSRRDFVKARLPKFRQTLPSSGFLGSDNGGARKVETHKIRQDLGFHSVGAHGAHALLGVLCD